MSFRAALSGLAYLMFAVTPTFAQTPETRVGEIARVQEEKAQKLEPYRRNFFEKKLLEIEEAGGFAVGRGLTLAFGDIKQGSSVALGPAYARTFHNGASFVAKGEYSIRQFKLLQLFMQAPPIANGRVLINGRARWQDAPELAVYPLGRTSPKTRAELRGNQDRSERRRRCFPLRSSDLASVRVSSATRPVAPAAHDFLRSRSCSRRSRCRALVPIPITCTRS